MVDMKLILILKAVELGERTCPRPLACDDQARFDLGHVIVCAYPGCASGFSKTSTQMCGCWANGLGTVQSVALLTLKPFDNCFCARWITAFAKA
jgi:hypothetical protein